MQKSTLGLATQHLSDAFSLPLLCPDFCQSLIEQVRRFRKHSEEADKASPGGGIGRLVAFPMDFSGFQSISWLFQLIFRFCEGFPRFRKRAKVVRSAIELPLVSRAAGSRL